MIATGPKPPLSFTSSNDEAPIKLDIGGGMGELRNVECKYKQCFERVFYHPYDKLIAFPTQLGG